MSTREIRVALDTLSDIADHPNAPVDVRNQLVRAIEEVEAIERAAKEWALGIDAPHKAAWINEIAESIAREAP